MNLELPNLSTDKDRLLYLAIEYKWPLVAVALSAGVWFTFVVDALPSPPAWTLPFTFAWALAAFPAYIIESRLFQRLVTDDRVTVGVADPGTKDVHTTYAIPREVWNEKHVVGYQPHEPSEGADYVVTKLNVYDDLEEIEVRGVDPDLTPAESYNSSERVDAVYKHHHTVKRQYSRVKALAADYATEIHDATMLQMMSAREKFDLAPGVEPKGLIEELEKDIEDLPDAPQPDVAPQHVRARGGATLASDELMDALDSEAVEQEASDQ